MLLLALARICGGWDIVLQILGTAQGVKIGLERLPIFPVDFILEGKKATSRLDESAFPEEVEGRVGHFSSRNIAREMGFFGHDSDPNCL